MKLKYITGRGGDGISGLSAHLASLSDDYHVLALDQYFLRKTFLEQVAEVQSFHAAFDGYLLANSYGAYLLLHSMIDQPASVSKIMLLSPALGRVNSEKRMLISRPPGEKAFKQAISESRLGIPKGMQILTGALDEVCDADLAKKMGDQLGIEVDILVGEGHMISKEKIADVLKKFIG